MAAAAAATVTDRRCRGVALPDGPRQAHARPHGQAEVDEVLRREGAEAGVVDVVILEGRRVARQAALLQQVHDLLGALLVWEQPCCSAPADYAYRVQTLALGIACFIFWCAGSYTKRCFDFDFQVLAAGKTLASTRSRWGLKACRVKTHTYVTPAPS